MGKELTQRARFYGRYLMLWWAVTTGEGADQTQMSMERKSTRGIHIYTQVLRLRREVCPVEEMVLVKEIKLIPARPLLQPRAVGIPRVCERGYFYRGL